MENSKSVNRVIVLLVVIIPVFALGFVFGLLSNNLIAGKETNTASGSDNQVDSTVQPRPTELGAIVTNRIKLISPVPGESIDSEQLEVAGEMQGFFEGTMNMRLQTNSGEIILDEPIQAQEDNYDQFAPFAAEFELPENTKFPDSQGILTFYEISPKDGSETELLQLSLELQVK